MPAPAFQPPDQPGVDLPAAPAALQQDTGTRGVQDRLLNWLGAAGLGGAAVLLTWKAWYGVQVDGWALGDTLVLVGAGDCFLGFGLLAFLLPFLSDGLRVLYTRRAWRISLANMEHNAATQRATAAGYARKWYGAAPPAPDTVVVNDKTVRDELAAQRRAIAHLQEQLSAAQRAPAEGAARVANPVQKSAENIPDAETRPMGDARVLLGGAYRNGPAWKLVQTAYRQAPITNGALVDGGWMSDDAWRALTRLLAAHGVLIRKGKGPTAPYTLAPPYAGAVDEAACHMAVLARLWAGGCGPGDLPGDLAGLDPAPTVAPTAAHSPPAGTDGPQPTHSGPQATHS